MICFPLLAYLLLSLTGVAAGELDHTRIAGG
jgi:hypothetical protein